MNTNNALSTLFKLSHNVRLYVPSTMDVNQTIDTSAYVDDAIILMSGLFGGATVHNAYGAWQSEQLGIVREDVTIVESYASSLEDIGQVIEYAERLKVELSQESVALEVDRELYLI